MKNPILLKGHTLAPVTVLRPSSLSVTLKAEPGNSASMSLQKTEPDVPVGSWVRCFTDQGDAGVFRVKSVSINYLTGQRDLSLESALNMLSDCIYIDEYNADKADVSIKAALSALLSAQTEKLFKLGTVAFGTTMPWNFSRVAVLSQMKTCLQAVEDPQWSVDFSSLPFTINIIKRPTVPTCEMRLSRNINTLSVSTDMTNMYTRIYPLGYSNLECGSIDRNTGTYGVIEKTETNNSIDDATALKAWGLQRLKRHCEPTVTATISGLELSEATGCSWDRLLVGTVCRVPLPEYNTSIVERIDSIAWKDIINQPNAVTVTLSNSRTDVTSIRTLAGKVASASSKASSAAKSGDDDTEKIIKHITETDKGFALQASRITDLENQYAEIKVEYDGIHIAATHAGKGSAGDWLTDMQSSLDVTAEAIKSTVKKGDIISSINQSAESITISASKINLSGYVTASELSATKAEIDHLKGGVSVFTVCKANSFSLGNNSKGWISFSTWKVFTATDGSRYYCPAKSVSNDGTE